MISRQWLLVPIAAVLALSGCKRDGEVPAGHPLPPAVVRVVVAEAKPLMATEDAVGTVRSETRAVIEANVSGRIQALPVRAGELVKKGDLIAQLDVQEIHARLDQAQAALEQAEQDLQRFKALLQQNVLTKAEYDTAEARQRIAKAAVVEAETMLGYAKVVAPFDGVITRKILEVGDLAAPGRGIVEMEDPDALRVEADVPEGLIRQVRLGQKMNVLSTGSANGVEAVVSEISPVADPASRTFLVKLDLPGSSGLRLGQFVRVAVPVGEKTSLRLPASAVVLRGQMELVFVDVNKTAQMRLVKTGRKGNGEIEIVSGLEAGERVVVAGAEQLSDGQALREQP